jgi:hypothetical protein
VYGERGFLQFIIVLATIGVALFSLVVPILVFVALSDDNSTSEQKAIMAAVPSFIYLFFAIWVCRRVARVYLLRGSDMKRPRD